LSGQEDGIQKSFTYLLTYLLISDRYRVDRFIAVTQPIKYAKHKNSKRIHVMLALTWIISAAISSPIALGMNYTERLAVMRMMTMLIVLM